MTASSALTLALVLSSAQPILQALPAGTDLPPGLSVDVVVGEVERQGKPSEGMIKVKAPSASQIVYWRQTSSLPATAKAKAKPAPTLASQAQHERDLLQTVADKEAGTVEAIADTTVDGHAAKGFGASIADTRFEVVVVDCGGLLVTLSTMGPHNGPAAETLKAVVAGSLASLRCPAPEKIK